MSNLIETAWLSYEKAVVPPNASAAQRHDMRHVFWAGAVACFNAVARSSLDDVNVAVAMMEDLHGEFKAYTRDVEEEVRRTPR